MFEKLERAYIEMSDAEIEALNLSDEQIEEISNRQKEFYLELMRRGSPSLLLHDYMEAMTGVVFTDEIETEYSAAFVYLVRFIAAAKAKAVREETGGDMRDKSFRKKLAQSEGW
jgi:hypothetical protein